MLSSIAPSRNRVYVCVQDTEEVRDTVMTPRSLPTLMLASLPGALSSNPASAQRYGPWHPGMMDGWGMGWFGGIFMIVLWILVIVGLVFFIKWLVQSTRDVPAGKSSPTSRALHILEERYARGEIDKQEFLDKKKDLFS
jgi:putative membrane protein